MATTQNLTIRIGADASGAMSVLSATTEQVNRLNTAGNTASRGGVASLSGGVENLGRWTATSAQAMASMSGGIQNIGRDASTAAGSFNQLNNQFTATNSGIILTARSAREVSASLGQLSSQANLVTTTMHAMTSAMGSSAQSTARWVQELNNSTRAAQQAANANEQLHRSNTAVSGSMSALKSVVGIIGLGALASDILKVNIEFESLRMRLIAVTGSSELGRIAFQNILQVAKETPQSVQEISKAYTMLKNFGIEPTMKVMQDLTHRAKFPTQS